MSDSLFNWNTKISQTSTGYGVTDNSNNNNNSYAKYKIDKKQELDTADILSKKSNKSNTSIVTEVSKESGNSDIKTQYIPTDLQSKLSLPNNNPNNPNEKTPSELKNIMYTLNGDISTIQAYKANYDKSINDLKNKMQTLGIENNDNILDIINQYPNLKTNTQTDILSCDKNDVRFEHFGADELHKPNNVGQHKQKKSQSLSAITNRAKETVDFVHKCHVRYWWINAIVRIVTISVFLIMLYKLSQYKKTK